MVLQRGGHNLATEQWQQNVKHQFFCAHPSLWPWWFSGSMQGPQGWFLVWKLDSTCRKRRSKILRAATEAPCSQINVFFFNVKHLLLCGRQSRGRKGKLQSWRKYLQTTYPTKDYFLEYIKNSQNSTVKAKQNPKPYSPIRKWAEDRNRHFTEEDLQISHKHAERCWTSLAIKEMQIKTTVKDVRGSPVVKNLPFNAEDVGSIPGLGRSHRWALTREPMPRLRPDATK